jgi:hypothetical protein
MSGEYCKLKAIIWSRELNTAKRQCCKIWGYVRQRQKHLQSPMPRNECQISEPYQLYRHLLYLPRVVLQFGHLCLMSLVSLQQKGRRQHPIQHPTPRQAPDKNQVRIPDDSTVLVVICWRHSVQIVVNGFVPKDGVCCTTMTWVTGCPAWGAAFPGRGTVWNPGCGGNVPWSEYDGFTGGLFAWDSPG